MNLKNHFYLYLKAEGVIELSSSFFFVEEFVHFIFFLKPLKTKINILQQERKRNYSLDNMPSVTPRILFQNIMSSSFLLEKCDSFFFLR